MGDSSDDDMLPAHWDIAREDIREVRKLIGERKVKSILAIRPDWCLESYPCQGHKGVEITLQDGEVITYDCPSVSIGCIQKVIMGKAEAHFEYYTRGFTP